MRGYVNAPTLPTSPRILALSFGLSLPLSRMPLTGVSHGASGSSILGNPDLHIYVRLPTAERARAHVGCVGRRLATYEEDKTARRNVQELDHLH